MYKNVTNIMYEDNSDSQNESIKRARIQSVTSAGLAK